MNKKRIHQQQSRRKQICTERLQIPQATTAKSQPQPEVSDEELDRRALASLEGKPMTKGAGQ